VNGGGVKEEGRALGADKERGGPAANSTSAASTLPLAMKLQQQVRGWVGSVFECLY